MTVALDALATGTTDSNATPQGTNVDSTLLTIGSGANRALIVMLSTNSGNATGLTVTWDALGTPQSLTDIESQANSQPNAWVAIFAMVAPTPGNKTLRVKWTGGGTMDVGIFSLSYTGVNQTGGTTSFPNANSAIGGSNSPSITITSASGNAAVAAFANPQTVFTSANQTEIYNDSNLVNINSAGQRAAGAASVAFNYTLTSTPAWVAVGCGILAAAAAAPSLALPRRVFLKRRWLGWRQPPFGTLPQRPERPVLWTPRKRLIRAA